MRASFALAAALAFAAAPAGADVKAGVDAWARGDFKAAVAQWRGPAIAGDPDAQFNLAQAYKLGRGVPTDVAAAELWYAKAAAQGHVQAEDNYGLALFQNGRARAAIPYLEKSAGRGEPRAQYILGTMLFNGADIEKDWPRAYALTSRAARAGLPQAAQSLGQMDTFLSPADRREGLALAQRMAGADPTPPDPPTLSGDPSRPPVVPSPPPARPAHAAQPGSPAPSRIASGEWRLQLGAFGEPGNARRLWSQVAGRFPGRSVSYVTAGALTRVLVGPFASRGEAAAACAALKPCVPLRRPVANP